MDDIEIKFSLNAFILRAREGSRKKVLCLGARPLWRRGIEIEG